MTITMSSAHSSTFPSLHLRHNSFSNPSVALPTSQLILQPFRCFTYVTVHSLTLSLLLRHKLFTQFSWRAAHVVSIVVPRWGYRGAFNTGSVQKCARGDVLQRVSVSFIPATRKLTHLWPFARNQALSINCVASYRSKNLILILINY